MTENSGEEKKLTELVRSTLERSGELARLNATIQAKVLETVRGGNKGALVKVNPKNRNSTTTLCNDLILEYFHWYGYQYTLNMFSKEADCSGECPNRQRLEDNVGDEYDKDLPVLMSILIDTMNTNK